MLWSFIAGRLTATAKPLPRPDKKKCLLHRQRVNSCRACSDACPCDALSVEQNQLKIDEEKCNGCGVCTSACPTQCLFLPTVNWGHIYIRIISGEECTIGCSQSESTAVDIRVPCCGSIHGELLAALILQRRGIPFYVDLSACSGCPGHRGKKQFSHSLSHARALTGDLFKGVFLITGDEPVTVDAEKLSRQQFFHYCREKLRTTAIDTYRNFIYTEEERVTPRQFLQAAVGKTRPGRFSLPTWKVDRTCSLCGLCRGLCPQEAWEIKTMEGEQQLIHHPWRCTQCNLCTASCAAIQEEEQPFLLAAGGTTKNTVRCSEASRCRRCGQLAVMQGDIKLCPNCSKQESLRAAL